MRAFRAVELAVPAAALSASLAAAFAGGVAAPRALALAALLAAIGYAAGRWLARSLEREAAASTAALTAAVRSAVQDSSYAAPLEIPEAAGLAPLVDAVNEIRLAVQFRDVERARLEDLLDETVAARTAEIARASEQLRAARDTAEAGAKSKSMFLANMSHEIRTPMNGILGMADLLRGSELTPQQQELLTTIRASAESLLTILNDVLDFSKIDAGKLELNPARFQLRDAVAAALGPLALQAERKGLELVARIHRDLPDLLVADAGRLRQILVNLVNNAVKFTERGEIEVSLEKESRNLGEITVHLSVRDTGIGIAKEDHEQIFRAFEQSDGSSARQYGGTGLGLAIASHLAGLMGGRVGLESELGRGSTFHCTLRCGLPGEGPAAALPSEAAALAGARILVLDDSAIARAALTEILDDLCISSVGAADPETALAALRSAQLEGNPFGVALVDSQIPGADGIAVAAQILAQKGLVRAVVLMLPQTERLSTQTRAQAAGVGAFLSKPVAPSDLRTALKIALGVEAPPPIQPPPSAVLNAQPTRGLKILLAEDNPVNQALAVRVLTPRGHDVTVAANGEEAVAAVRDTKFDVVLMDLSMPRMDGLKATSIIRELEQGTGEHLRILAVTAHALKGDKERCLQAGMDGYLTKPIRMSDLFALVEGHSAERAAARAPELPLFPDREEESVHGITRRSLLEKFEGSEDALREIAQVFLETSPALVAGIRSAADRGDIETLRETAHSLKGSVTIFSVPSAYEAAASLEKLARAGDLPSARERIDRISAEVARLEEALRALAL